MGTQDILRRAALLKSQQPTEAQKKAGNYKKKHTSFQGIPISIENKAGSYREGKSRDGVEWRTKMHYDYGYIKKTLGADGDHVDVFLGPNKEADTVFVVNQVTPGTGKFDEHKVMLGFDSEDDARKGYLKNYEAGWKGLGSIKAMSMPDFKEWLGSSKTTRILKTSQWLREQERIKASGLALLRKVWSRRRA